MLLVGAVDGDVIRKTKKSGAEDPLYDASDDVNIHDGGVSSRNWEHHPDPERPHLSARYRVPNRVGLV